MASTSATPTISAVLIVKDEEDVLATSLAALGWVDEIIVYDTGSTDSTRQIARGYTPDVVEGYWDDDFGAARNRALEHATSEWILVVDADETVGGDVETIRPALAAARAHLYLMAVIAYDGDVPRTDAPHITARVFRNAEYMYAGRLHEQLVPRSPGTPATMEQLTEVHLRHTGYSEDAIEKHDKRNRNLALARRELEEKSASGCEPARLDLLRANLARALASAGEVEEALAVGRDVRDAGRVPPTTVAEISTALVRACALAGMDDAVDEWLEVWERVDTSVVWARGVKARVLGSRGLWTEALEVLDTLPTTHVDRERRRFVKHDLVDLEIRARRQTGSRRRARRAAQDALAAGCSPGDPADLVELFDADGALLALVTALPDALWREYVARCAVAPSLASATMLRTMAAVRPDDLSVRVCRIALAPLLGFEELVDLADGVRAAGLGEVCPLVRVSDDATLAPRHRALAAAIALSVYDDARALPGLEAALGAVPPADEADLLAELESVAPGLVSAS